MNMDVKLPYRRQSSRYEQVRKDATHKVGRTWEKALEKEEEERG
jgi:hypothetical protein